MIKPSPVPGPDFRLLSGCVAANMAEQPQAIPAASNPIVVVLRPRSVGRSLDRSSSLGMPVSPLGTLEEGASEEEEEEGPRAGEEAGRRGSTVVLSAAELRPGLVRKMSSLRAHPTVSPEGPTVVGTRASVRIPLMEFALYRGSGRGEPLAVLSLHHFAADVDVFAADVNLLAPSTTTLHASVAAISLEDLRDGGGGGGDGTKRRPVAFGGCLEGGGGLERSRGGLLPLLVVEATTGPAVGGTRAAVMLQHLRLEVDPAFLLDVGRVFVPTLAGGGGEAPEEVLPKDIRLEPGKLLKLTGDEKLGRTQRLLADGVAGGEYELDGGGFVLTVDEIDVFSGPVIFVGPGAKLTLRNVCIEVAAVGGAKAVWPYLVRLAPGAKIRADPTDKVYYASSTPDGGLDTHPLTMGGTGTDQKPAPAPAPAVKAATKTELSFRATCLELRVVGEVGEDGGHAGGDMINLTLGMSMDVTLESHGGGGGGGDGGDDAVADDVNGGSGGGRAPH
jgi:hypothetical protein